MHYLTLDKLREYFEAFGPVDDAVVMKDPVTRRSRGFGFITFKNASYVDVALDRDSHTIDSRKVIVFPNFFILHLSRNYIF